MGSPNVNFKSIPDNIRKPGVYIEENVSNAITGLQAKNDSIVLLAQMTSSGSVAAETPTKVFSDADAALYFGRGSIAHLSAKALLYANPNADLTVMPLADNGSTKATGKIAFTDATAADNGSVSVWVGDVGVSVAYAAGDTKATIAANLHAALSPVSGYLPVTDASSDSTITMTCRNAGTLGNSIYLSAKATTSLGITITGFTGGATDSTLGSYDTTSTPLGKIVGGGYSIIVNTLPDSVSMDAVKDMVDFVSGPLEERPAIQVCGSHDRGTTDSSVKTLCGTTLNHGRTSYAYINYANDNIAKSDCWKIASAYAGILASQADPAVPYDGLILNGIAAPAVINRFSRTQQESFLNSGVSCLIILPGENVAITRAISTYTTNSFGNPDITLLDINTYRTLDYVRYQILLRLQARFQRAKLSARTPNLVKSQVLDVLYLLEDLEIVKNVKTYAPGVVAEIDTGDPTRVNIKIPAPIVEGLHEICGVIDLILS